jgi:hypothetical protein
MYRCPSAPISGGTTQLRNLGTAGYPEGSGEPAIIFEIDTRTTSKPTSTPASNLRLFVMSGAVPKVPSKFLALERSTPIM